MTDTDQNKEDKVLKRMLKTPPKKNEGKTARERKKGADRKADPSKG